MSQRDYSYVNVESGGSVHQGDFITNNFFQNSAREGPPLDPKLLLRDALAYEGAFTRNDQLSSRPPPPRSLQWIWSTPFRKWLSNKSDRLFWITGKPGSGKSTLIHYLADANDTRNHLCSGGQQYKIVHFFFDYRAGDSAANSERGLIKCFLSQLCSALSDVEKQLAERNSHDSLKEKSTAQLLEVFCSVLNSVPNPICAFIDGLDEYTGNFVGLATLLATLQNRTSIKLCLGSRPEAAFRTAYGHLPSLAMQDHNSNAMETYIDYAIKNARDSLVDVDAVINSAVRKELHSRAHGVMIWLRLATDELVEAAATGVSRARISEILEGLPEDLEHMYNHTFLKISPKDAHEAALLLFLINELDGAVDLQILQGLWSFYEADFLQDQRVDVLISRDRFEERLYTLIGSFTDFVDRKWERNFQRPFLRYMRTQEESYTSRKARELKFWTKPREVRLIHRTLDTFLRRSDSVRSSLPPRVRNSYPDNVKSRVYADVIAAASDARYFDPDNTADQYQKDNEEKNSHSLLDAPIKILTRVVKDQKWKSRINALIHCVMSFPKAARALQLPCAPIYSTWRAAMGSPLMFLELRERTASSVYADCLFRRYDGFVDLRLAVEYGLRQYISEANELGASARPQIWYELLEEIPFPSEKFKFNVYPTVPRSIHESLLDFRADPKSLMALVSARCYGIPSKFLSSLAGFPMKWWWSSYYLDHVEFFLQLSYTTLTSMSSLPIVDNSVAEPSKCDYTRKECLSAMWARSSYYWQYRPPGLRIAAVPSILSKVDRLLAKVIHENDNENVVNNVCERHGTALHVSVIDVSKGNAQDIRGRSAEPYAMLNKLIVLARLGADPNIQHNGKTPLQVLEAQISWRNKQVQAAIEILRHHKTKGCWPDFEPIIKQYNLKGPALWKFDDHGRIVLDPLLGPAELSDQTLRSNVPEVNDIQIQDSTTSATHGNVNVNDQPSLVEGFLMSGGLGDPSEPAPTEQPDITDSIATRDSTRAVAPLGDSSDTSDGEVEWLDCSEDPEI